MASSVNGVSKDNLIEIGLDIARKKEVADFIIKPIDENELTDAISSIVENKESKLIKCDDDPIALITEIGLYFIGPKLGKGGSSTVFSSIYYPFKEEMWKSGMLLTRKTPHTNLAISFTASERQYARIQQIYDQLSSETKKYFCPIFKRGRTEDGGNWMVSERCVKTLREMDYSKVANPTQVFYNIMRELKEGLRLFHQDGFVHRDIKPSNIFLTAQNHVQIGDLGLAVKKGKEALPSGTSYYRPQALESKNITFRAGFIQYYEFKPYIARARDGLCSYGVTMYEQIKSLFFAYNALHVYSRCNCSNLVFNRIIAIDVFKQLEEKLSNIHYRGNYNSSRLELFGQMNGGGRATYRKAKNGRPGQVTLLPSTETVRSTIEKMYLLFENCFAENEAPLLKRMCDLSCDLTDQRHFFYPNNMKWDFDTLRLGSDIPWEDLLSTQDISLFSGDDDEASSSAEPPQKRARLESETRAQNGDFCTRFNEYILIDLTGCDDDS